MCDYSLGGLPNRLAVEGEELAVYKFRTGSLGLASVADVPSRTPWSGGLSGFCKRLLDYFREPCDVPAVCIPPGAELSVFGIPEDLQKRLNVSDKERVAFVQTSANPYTYRDAIQFSSGEYVLLQKLSPGIRMRVRSLGSDVEQTELIPSEIAYR